VRLRTVFICVSAAFFVCVLAGRYTSERCNYSPWKERSPFLCGSWRSHFFSQSRTTIDSRLNCFPPPRASRGCACARCSRSFAFKSFSFLKAAEKRSRKFGYVSACVISPWPDLCFALGGRAERRGETAAEKKSSRGV
jgi:hypothetical protein